MRETVNVVHNIEFHLLEKCPCASCQSERDARTRLPLGHIRINPKAAHQLGIVDRLTPEGSKVRRLLAEQSKL